MVITRIGGVMRKGALSSGTVERMDTVLIGVERRWRRVVKGMKYW